MKFGHEILKYREEILRDLSTLIEIPSVCSTPLQGKPFGESSAQALGCILNMAENMGFKTTNVGNYAGAAYYGEDSEYVDVLTHIDVVPAGDGWNTDPFQLFIKDNVAYGRGVADDKGAAIVSLYCLKALKDAGIKGKYTLRTVFGGGEEIASDDLDQFYAVHPYPVMGFTPDCSYGICHSEKGILRLGFNDSDNNNSCIKEFHAGLAVNSVPAKAFAKISCSDELHQKLLVTADADHFSFEREEWITTIHSVGVAAHGAEPMLGFNAASNLIQLICKVFPAENIHPLLAFLNDCIGMEFNGNLLGISMEDEPSGELTLNLGIVEINEKEAHASVDIRYPVTKQLSSIIDAVQKRTENYQIDVSVLNHTAPLYVPKDYPLIQRLTEAYESVVGEPCQIYSTGGGTYARQTNNTSVAFGPGFPGVISNAHNCNEHMDLEQFFLHAQICLEAMYLLFTK